MKRYKLPNLNLLVLISVVALSSLSHAKSLNGQEFIACFEKAFNERVSELHKKYPHKKDNMCTKMTDEAKIKLIKLYSEPTVDGLRAYDSAEEMGHRTVRYYYEQLEFAVPCYKPTKFIGTAFVKGFGAAIGAYKHTDFQLVEDSFTKLLSRKMWDKNGSVYFAESDFSYCKDKK